jgi:tetratricopeptide (TPR) repeat protein
MDPNLHLELGDVYLTRNKLDSAVLEFRQAKELATQRPEPYYKYALTLKRQADELAKDGKKKEADALYNEALQNARSAAEKDPHFTAAYTLEVEILRALGKEEDANKVLQEHAEANPTPENAAPAAAPEASEAKTEKEQPKPAEEPKSAENKEHASKKKAPVIEESEPDALPVEVPGKR